MLAASLTVSYDDKLRFKPHIDKKNGGQSLIARQANLKRFQSLDPKLFTKAFCVFVRPIIRVC